MILHCLLELHKLVHFTSSQTRLLLVNKNSGHGIPTLVFCEVLGINTQGDKIRKLIL